MGFRSFPRSSHAAHLPPKPNVRELDYFLNLNAAFEGDSDFFSPPVKEQWTILKKMRSTRFVRNHSFNNDEDGDQVHLVAAVVANLRTPDTWITTIPRRRNTFWTRSNHCSTAITMPRWFRRPIIWFPTQATHIFMPYPIGDN